MAPKISQMCDKLALMASEEYVQQVLKMCRIWAKDLHAIDPTRFPEDIPESLAFIGIDVAPVCGKGFPSRVSFKDLLGIQAARTRSKHVLKEIQDGMSRPLDRRTEIIFLKIQSNDLHAKRGSSYGALY